MPELCVIPGDGIGKEVVPAAVAILEAVIPDLDMVFAEAGWECFLTCGSAVPESTLETIQSCGAALFGAVSSPSHAVRGYRSAILVIRQSLDLYANVRPVRSWPKISPRSGVDMIIVRENSEGLYVGRERLEGGTAVTERVITRKASFRIGNKALNLGITQQRQKVTIVHKANVLTFSDGLFRDAVRDAISDELAVDELLVDAAAYRLMGQPESFDVVVTTNLYGDILSDAAAHWGGGLGMAPSLNWGDQIAVAEPVHGSAPDIAGKGVANPIAAILSGALLARYVWGNTTAADRIENAVAQALDCGAGQLNSTKGITDSILALI
ncbi:MAG: isocitrate/isopropylmalate dehydrogenase family protein [Candidatus Promineifilaceae bacterium]|nr:isocitrate/isopropylmalate dehydrogenase family protein [Candidatus Promineifilaceae bacterium]